MINRRIRTLFWILALALSALRAVAQVPSQPNPNFEYGVDRPGGDYRNFELQFDAPGLCAGQCAQEAQCRAWTYVKPGVQGPNARCWLKNVVPAPLQGANFAISGLRGSTAEPPVTPPVTPPVAGVGLTGQWGSYNFVQTGNAFTWTIGSEVGQGTVFGDNLQVSWTGGGKATGRITQRSAAGDPIRLEWSNGVVMARNPPR